mmetsp:Transcript_21747/g.38245  ORF Transcript_21747/g.38245 Transcript_21747/m.38245 type:complete len:185 (-) Transcript_21747:58-612(-)
MKTCSSRMALPVLAVLVLAVAVPVVAGQLAPAPAPAAVVASSPAGAAAPCPSMNNTQVIQQMENLAKRTATSAQQALDAVGQFGEGDTSTAAKQALSASLKASEAWQQASTMAREALAVAKGSKKELKIMHEMLRNGANEYAEALSKVEIAPPVVHLVDAQLSVRPAPQPTRRLAAPRRGVRGR